MHVAEMASLIKTLFFVSPCPGLNIITMKRRPVNVPVKAPAVIEIPPAALMSADVSFAPSAEAIAVLVVYLWSHFSVKRCGRSTPTLSYAECGPHVFSA